MTKRRLLLTSAIMLALTTPAHAEQMTMAQMQTMLEKLSNKVDTLSSTVQKQDQVIAAQKAQISSQNAALQAQNTKVSQQSAAIEKMASIAPAAGGDDQAVKVTMDNKGLKVSSADGKYSLQPFGRVHVDFTHFQDDKKDHPDGANFRRARLGLKGDIGEDLNYKAEIDFGSEAVNLKEVYLAYTGFKPAEFWLGNFKPPMGLEQNTSSNYQEFVELAPVSNAFTRDEIIGTAAKTGGDNWSLTGGIFNEDASVNTTDDESWSFDARASADLLPDSPNVLHVGAGASYRTPNATTESITLGAKPAGTGTNVVSTGAMTNVDNALVLGAEAAAVFGPFSVQGEYMRFDVNRDSGSDPNFDGWYAQASYFITGETRPYKGKTGNFERVKPNKPLSPKNGNWGAWEVLGRVDNLDLNDSGNGINGGEMTDWTLGVNWYLRDNARIMFNYVDVNTDDNGVVPNDDPKVMTLRTQWDF